MIDPKRRKSSCCFPGADARGVGQRGGRGGEVCLVIISFNRFIGFIRVIFGGGAELRGWGRGW